MIRPLDRDTRGPARGSNAGSAPGPSRRITAASDTRFRSFSVPKRRRHHRAFYKIVRTTKSRAPFYVFVASRLAFVPPGAPPHTSHRLRFPRFPGWVRELGHELALRRHRNGRAPRTAVRERPRRRRRRSPRRFVLFPLLGSRARSATGPRGTCTPSWPPSHSAWASTSPTCAGSRTGGRPPRWRACTRSRGARGGTATSRAARFT